MPLFEVAFVRVPPIAEQEQGISERLLGGPYAEIGSDQSGAVANATMRLLKEQPSEKIDSNVKILCRPFS